MPTDSTVQIWGGCSEPGQDNFAIDIFVVVNQHGVIHHVWGDMYFQQGNQPYSVTPIAPGVMVNSCESKA